MTDYIKQDIRISLSTEEVSGSPRKINDGLKGAETSFPHEELIDEISFNVLSSFRKKKAGATKITSQPSPETSAESIAGYGKERAFAISREMIGGVKDSPKKIKLVVETDTPSPEATLGGNQPQPEGIALSSVNSQKETSYPLREILTFQDPLTIEQLTDLHEMLELHHNRLESGAGEKIFSFALEIAKKKGPDSAAMLGKLILSLNLAKDLRTVSEEVNDSGRLEKWVNEAYEFGIKQSEESLNRVYDQHLRNPLQNAEIARRSYLPILLSQILVSKTGRVNFGAIDLICQTNFMKEAIPSTYKQHLFWLLHSIRDNLSLREKIASITMPLSHNAPASSVIRATFGISSNQMLSDLDAKRTAFAALASHLRQGKEGSCFATPLSIFLLSTQLERCLNDFESMLGRSKLTRHVNKIEQDFPFILKMSGNGLEKPLHFTREGKFTGEAYLSEAPGIIAACRSIGIESPNEALSAVLDDMNPSSELNRIDSSVKTILQKLAEFGKSLDCNKGRGLAHLYQCASFAFEAQECNPLLKVWENSIAGMAEPNETGMVCAAVIDAIVDTLSKKLKTSLPSKERKALKKFLRSEISSYVHLQYDPLIPFKSLAEDHQSTNGAFVLYSKASNAVPNEWKRIDTPSTFQSFVLRLLENARAKLELAPESIPESFIPAFQELTTYVNTESFLIACLNEYYHRNSEIPAPLTQPEEIKYAPWITRSGNNFSKVIQVYFENFIKSNSEVYSPKGTKGLFLKIIALGKMVLAEKGLNQQNTAEQLVPLRISGIHAFNLLLSHPTLSDALKQNGPLDEWFATSIAEPVKQFSGAIMDKEAKRKFIDSILLQIVPVGRQAAIQKALEESTNNLTVIEVRNATCDLITPIFSEQKVSKEEIRKQVDLTLISTLPKDFSKTFKGTILHFADSNWSDGIHDIHFCFLMNPGNGELEMWAAYEDDSKLFPIAQDQWINLKKWEFFQEL